MDWAESARTATGVAFDFPVGDAPTTGSSSPAMKVPRRIQKRLESNRGGTCTAEEIEAKLREADLRRQQFHEWLSSKARPKPRSPSWSSQEEDLGQRLEAKLHAAEQKRLNLLAKAQVRLARLDELRQAAKTGVELRFEKEREKLGTKVKCRVQQAEANRMLLLKANLQRRAALQERTSRSLLQRKNRENKYKERVRAAIFQKRAAAEKKRLKFLEAEKKRAHARVVQALRVSNSVFHQREIERRRMKEQLEDKLQKAMIQRAEYLRQRGSPHSSCRNNCKMQKHGDILSRKLGRCWKKFVTTKGTTWTLAKAYEGLGINENHIRSMRFEQLAICMESTSTLQIVKAFLDRLESRFNISLSSSPSGPENLDHLLKHLGSPKKRGLSSKLARSKGQTRKGSRDPKSRETQKLSRYAVRVVLCAYMILGHPDAVFSGQGERENELADAAFNFVREFELLTKIILSTPNSSSLKQPLLEGFSDVGSSDQLLKRPSFRSQLTYFDAAWHSYLYRFVVWKVKDARSLEDDLVRAACQLELSMMQTCKFTSDGQGGYLTHDMKAVQKQVTEDQKLLRERVKHLGGNAGIERLESALSDTRFKYYEAKENGCLTPVSHISSPLFPSHDSSASSSVKLGSSENDKKSTSVVRSLFVERFPSIAQQIEQDISMKDTHSSSESLGFGNVHLVNEFLHEHHHALVGNLESSGEDEQTLVKAKIKETMEKAFWDSVTESLKNDQCGYGRVIMLVSEVRDELCKMAPLIWKQEIHDAIDVEILTQVLDSGSHDMDYLGKILDYALSMLRRLSAPANEDEMKETHQKLLNELSSTAQSIDKLNSSFVIAIVKALKFVLDQIQVLRREISKARIQMMIPIIKGPAGVEYLQNAFRDHYGSPSDAQNNLPLATQWISTVRCNLEEWNEYTEISSTSMSQGLPHAPALRSGGSILSPFKSSSSSSPSHASVSIAGAVDTECKGERIDLLLRLGLLKLVSGIEGLSKEIVPETFSLNLPRLRTVQGKLQNIVVISTSMLVLRQILNSENMTTGSSDIENIISSSVKSLSYLLVKAQDVGIEEIIDAILSASSEVNLEEKKEVMARVLVKSLQAGDTVFKMVSRSVYLAARGIIFGGTGDRGRGLADTTLRRMGASMLVDQLVGAVEVLIVMAKVSGQVHRSWYENLV